MSRDLKIACILDEFSFECFKYECTLIPLDALHWTDTLLRARPDLLLVESAWKGSKGAWTNKIESLHLKKDNSLKHLVEYCKMNKIPTVFWNKEDPIHYDIFIEAATLFDYVFTTDSDSVEKYKKRLGHSRVFTLPFAAQPKIHNPIDKDSKKSGNVAFAGSWYNNHPNRIKSMEKILKPAFNYGLDIYDRNYNYQGNLFKYPEVYRPYIKGSVPYGQIQDIYKKYKVFLNVNIITDSPTMFSRRVFELLACGTPVISGPSLGIEKMFKDIVQLPQTEKDVSDYMNMLINDTETNNRLSIRGQREVFGKHTYKHRVDEIIKRLGLNHKKAGDPGVSIIAVTANDHSIRSVFENYSRQSFKNKELIIIINKNDMDINEWRKEAVKYNNVRIFNAEEGKALEGYIRIAVDNSAFDYISLFDDSSYYGPDFINDLMNVFQYADTDVAGKHSCFVYFEDKGALTIYRPDMENRYAPSLAAGTAIAKKSVFSKMELIKEPGSGEYIISSLDCNEPGIKLYSSDMYNYVRVIKPQVRGFTRDVEVEDLLKCCRFVAHTFDYKEYTTV